MGFGHHAIVCKARRPGESRKGLIFSERRAAAAALRSSATSGSREKQKFCEFAVSLMLLEDFFAQSVGSKDVQVRRWVSTRGFRSVVSTGFVGFSSDAGGKGDGFGLTLFRRKWSD